MSKSKKVVILGAGPAALSAGLTLLKAGFPVILLEREKQVGGISKTVEYKGFRFDVGGHRFFTRSDEVMKLWQETLGKDFLLRPRLSRIYYQGKFFKYPIELGDTLKKAGLRTSLLCMASFIRYHLFPIRPEKSFADWVTNRFGRKLFLMFFKSYTEKVWGISTEELSADWAAQRIKGLSLWEAVKNSLFKPKKKIKTLIEEFHYPKYGPGMMYQAMADKIINLGGKIELGQTITVLNEEGRRIKSITAKDENGEEIALEADYFISTIPLPDTLRFLRPELSEFEGVEKELTFRDFISVNLIIKKKVVFPDNWIYVHDPRVKLGRIQNFKNWSEFMTPDERMTPIGCEYFCNQGDELWTTNDDKLIKLASRELQKLGLIKKGMMVDGLVYRMRDAYPVYMGDYQKVVSRAKKELSKIENLQIAGRGGMFRYNNMDHSILSGIYTAKNIMGEHHDVWQVNAEEEYHEIKKSAKG